jgi:hypothetical protein
MLITNYIYAVIVSNLNGLTHFTYLLERPLMCLLNNSNIQQQSALHKKTGKCMVIERNNRSYQSRA